LPHVPQLAGSFCVSTHLSPHCVLPPLQTLDVQVPLTHDWPAEHFVPHAPQLFGSNCVTVHVVPQSVAPLPQPPLPPSKSSVSGERTPHAAKRQRTEQNKKANRTKRIDAKRSAFDMPVCHWKWAVLRYFVEARPS